MELSPSVPSPSLFDLSGQNVLITGASRGQSRTSLSLHYLISPLVLFIPDLSRQNGIKC